jgi:predicted ArsR family transcriptional regulator
LSIYAIVWAYEQPITNAGEKFTLVTAAQYCNDQGLCWVKQDTLAEDMSMGVSTVRRHLSALEKAEVIDRIERRRQDGTRSSDFIKLLGFSNRSNRADDAPTTAQIEQTNRSNRAG